MGSFQNLRTQGKLVTSKKTVKCYRKMFQEQTVFVIGAGAGVDVGMPTGNQLIDLIAEKTNIVRDEKEIFDNSNSLVSGSKLLASAIGRLAPKQQYGEYLASARRISAAMPQATSIDSFIHARSDDPRIAEIGKLAICESILEAEQNSPITRATDATSNQIDFSNKALADTWHKTFFQILSDGVQSQNVEHIFSDVTFIVFNYDRCLERYLWSSLQNRFGIPPQEATRIIQNGHFIHPYGSVGDLFHENPDACVPFGTSLQDVDLLHAAKGIKTFSEQVSSDLTLRLIRTAMSNAKQIVFLGFAFHQQNMALLRCEKGERVALLYGSGFGISRPNIEAIKIRIASALNTHLSRVWANIDQVDCKTILTEYAYALSR